MKTSPSHILVEWLSEGNGNGSRQKLIDGMEALKILSSSMEHKLREETKYNALRELSDCSILNFDERGNWSILPTRLALIKKEQGKVRAVISGARDSNTVEKIEKLPSNFEIKPLGSFGLQLLGTEEEIIDWTNSNNIKIEDHWIPMQVKSAEEELGYATVRQACNVFKKLPAPFAGRGPIMLKRLTNGFRPEVIRLIPDAEVGLVIEISEPYTNRRIRYVGTDNGWLKVPYLWAPWIASFSLQPLTKIEINQPIAVPLWARLPSGLSRAVTLSSGETWSVKDKKLVSGGVPSALAFTLKKLLSLG
jgi:hypothetical protein